MKAPVPEPKHEPMIVAVSSIPLPQEPGPTQEVAELASVPATWTRDDFQREVQAFIPRLFRMCMALCRDTAAAEDLLQNSLVKAYVARGSFEGRGSFVGWLFGIVRHEHDELVRTTARRRSLMTRALEQCAVSVEDLLATPPPDPEKWVGLEEHGSILLDCLRAIPEPYRMVVWLCDVEELPQDEVARTLGIAEGTVKSRHARGRARLRLAYERRLNGSRLNSSQSSRQTSGGKP